MDARRLNVILGWTLLAWTGVGWPATHVLVVITKPEGSSNWVFHLLLALSWAAILISAMTFLMAAYVHKDENA